MTRCRWDSAFGSLLRHKADPGFLPTRGRRSYAAKAVARRRFRSLPLPIPELFLPVLDDADLGRLGLALLGGAGLDLVKRCDGDEPLSVGGNDVGGAWVSLAF